MYKNKRWIVFMAGLLVFIACFPMTAKAAARRQETRIPVETVTINVESAVREGDMSGYIMITKDSDSYSVGNYEWSGIDVYKRQVILMDYRSLLGKFI